MARRWTSYGPYGDRRITRRRRTGVFTFRRWRLLFLPVEAHWKCLGGYVLFQRWTRIRWTCHRSRSSQLRWRKSRVWTRPPRRETRLTVIFVLTLTDRGNRYGYRRLPFFVMLLLVTTSGARSVSYRIETPLLWKGLFTRAIVLLFGSGGRVARVRMVMVVRSWCFLREWSWRRRRCISLITRVIPVALDGKLLPVAMFMAGRRVGEVGCRPSWIRVPLSVILAGLIFGGIFVRRLVVVRAIVSPFGGRVTSSTRCRPRASW